VSKRLERHITTNSTMSGYKNGREGDKVMHSFEHAWCKVCVPDDKFEVYRHHER